MIIAFKLNYGAEKQSNKNQCSTSATSNKYSFRAFGYTYENWITKEFSFNIPFVSSDYIYSFELNSDFKNVRLNIYYPYYNGRMLYDTNLYFSTSIVSYPPTPVNMRTRFDDDKFILEWDRIASYFYFYILIFQSFH